MCGSYTGGALHFVSIGGSLHGGLSGRRLISEALSVSMPDRSVRFARQRERENGYRLDTIETLHSILRSTFVLFGELEQKQSYPSVQKLNFRL